VNDQFLLSNENVDTCPQSARWRTRHWPPSPEQETAACPRPPFR